MPSPRTAITLALAGMCMLAGCGQPSTPPAAGQTQLTSTAAQPASGGCLNPDDIMTVDQLRPGMKGYGLTVFSGARPERFEVEIVSVLRNYDPKTDMIVIRCSGHDLEKTGIASGMSGSPIYINGKLIGALAFGWSFTVEPIAGVQPIQQMMRNSGLACDLPPATQCDNGQCAVSATDRFGGQAVSVGQMFSRPRGEKPGLGRSRSRGRGRALTFGRIGGDRTRLVPLAIPLAVSGASPAVMDFLREQLDGTGIVPMQSGGSGGDDPRMADARIEPGSTVTVPLMTGDMDISAGGTVTAVMNDRVLAFGHPMFAEGPVNLPMGIGIVHTFIPSMYSSFKMLSAGQVVGAIRRDENSSILGVMGQKPAMSPMTVRISDWTGAAREYHYQLADEWYFGPMMAAVAAMSSAESEHGSPIDSTMHYNGRIVFRGMPPYSFSGVSSGSWAGYDLASRIYRPIDAMLNNSWGKGFVESIELDIRTINENREVNIERARLEKATLLPGEAAVINVTLERHKKPRLDKKIKVELPADLADGTYQLSLLDAEGYRYLISGHDPRTFSPENMAEMVTAFNKLAVPRDDHLYVVLTLPRGGLTSREERLPALPGSRAMILRQAGRESFSYFVEDVAWPVPMTDMIVSGSANFAITIDRNKDKK